MRTICYAVCVGLGALLTVLRPVPQPERAATPPRGLELPAYNMSRDTLRVGDNYRDWAYVWSIDGNAAGVVKLQPKATRNFVATLPMRTEHYPGFGNEAPYRNGFVIAKDTPAGEYTVMIGDVDTGLPIRVEAPAAERKTVRLTQQVTAADNNTLIEREATWGRNLILQPGPWPLARTLNLPAGTVLTGHGAVLLWQWPEPWNGTTYHQRALTFGDGCTFTGLTFDFSRSGFMTWMDGVGAGTVFHGCTFAKGSLGAWNQTNVVVNDCKFDRCGSGSVGGGTWINCDFDRLGGAHAFSAEQGYRLYISHCRFRDTDRGLVLRSGWGPHDRCYYGWLTFSGQSWVDNGCEIIGREGRGLMDRCLFYRIRAYDTEGQINFWEGATTRCKFLDGVLAGPSFIFAASDGANQSDNLISNWELRGGAVIFGATAKRNRCVNVACVNPQPTRANQFWHDHKPYDPGKTAAFVATRPAGYDPATDPDANTCSNCKVVGTGAAKPFDNVKVLAP